MQRLYSPLFISLENYHSVRLRNWIVSCSLHIITVLLIHSHGLSVSATGRGVVALK